MSVQGVHREGGSALPLPLAHHLLRAQILGDVVGAGKGNTIVV